MTVRIVVKKNDHYNGAKILRGRYIFTSKLNYINIWQIKLFTFFNIDFLKNIGIIICNIKILLNFAQFNVETLNVDKPSFFHNQIFFNYD